MISLPLLLAAAHAEVPSRCSADLAEPPEALSVAWISPLRRKARARTWLWVVPTSELRARVAEEGGGIARTLQLVGQRKRSKEPSRRYKVTIFDVRADALCRPLDGVEPAQVVAGVPACSERLGRASGTYDGCGVTPDLATGADGLPAYRARWRDLAVHGFCVLPLDRLIGAS